MAKVCPLDEASGNFEELPLSRQMPTLIADAEQSSTSTKSPRSEASRSPRISDDNDMSPGMGRAVTHDVFGAVSCSSMDTMGTDVSDFRPVKACGSSFVIYESNSWRKLWNFVLFLLLMYTGTVFPYRLCFLDFTIPEATVVDQHWQNFEIVVDILFWFDLFINFFFTYSDDFGNEIDCLGSIVKKYLQFYFMLNLIACLPEEAVAPFFYLFMPNRSGSSDSSMNQLGRLARLQRTTRLARLARLVRLARLAKLITLVPTSSGAWRWMQSLRGMRVINFIIFLFWIVHILACGWYLCAALHTDFTETWVGRRVVAMDGSNLLTREPSEQWMHSMYFVFTIFRPSALAISLL